MKISGSKISSFVTVLFFFISFSSHSYSIELADTTIPDTIKLGKESLVLNGAGIRTKFFFNIYIGSLYLKNKESDTDKILNDPHTKRITLNFLYKEIDKEKLTNGWIAGFKNNNSDATFQTLKTRLDQFNSYFETTHKGDSVQLDFLSTKNTRVTINSKNKGEIKGSDFQTALLKVWLGNDPADYALKDAMLGIEDY